MGINADHVRFLLSAKWRGVKFDRTATIGRQNLVLNRRSLQKILADFQVVLNPKRMQELMDACTGYSEPFWRLLGAQQIVSLDASPYEGATLIHDMNQPIPDTLKACFDAVIDSGSLEHIFNFPVAIKNCMEMVAVNGHFFVSTPTNNYPGHGVYQFSAELFLRILSAENGYVLERSFVVEEREPSRWFQAIDPLVLQRRAPFTNRLPTTLLLQAKRISEIPIFTQAPQQSDYVRVWSSGQLQDDAMRTGRPLVGADGIR